MVQALNADEQTKELLKQAIVEVFQEQQEWFSSLFAEVLEDAMLVRAIREGEDSPIVSRDEVFTRFERAD